VSIDPFPFQKVLVDKLGDPSIRGRLIGDEPGLGKTYEAIWIDQRLRAPYNRDALWRQRKMRTLVIAPWSVHEFWARTIKSLTGETAVVINRKKRHEFIEAVRAGRARYYICHYESMVLKDMKPMANMLWFHVIGDEIHRIKSEKSKQRMAVRMLKCQYKTGMSGTLADNSPADFWSPLNWVEPELFPSQKSFKANWCQTEEVQGRFLGLDPQTGEPIHQLHDVVVGLREELLPAFHKKIAPFYMRRRKVDVGIDLPEKYYTVVNVELLPSQRKVYEDLRKKWKAWIGEQSDQKLDVISALSKLTRLQQAALATLEWDEGKYVLIHGKEQLVQKVRLIEPSAKLDSLTDWMKDHGSEQVIVFSRSRSMINLVEKRLIGIGLRVGKYTGETPDRFRQPIIDDFQAGKLDVFVATIKTASESITLTAASTVIFLDRDWNPHKNEQAESRAHRIGQVHPVQIVDFFALRTVDSKVRETNIRKYGQLKAILGDDQE
jgi:SNF2 family DNA or RNA helicase